MGKRVRFEINIKTLARVWSRCNLLGEVELISPKDIKSMPITFVIAPIVLAFLVSMVFISYNDAIAEKEYITNLSCPELRQYSEDQIVESKKYFGNEAFLNYAEELYSIKC